MICWFCTFPKFTKAAAKPISILNLLLSSAWLPPAVYWPVVATLLPPRFFLQTVSWKLEYGMDIGPQGKECPVPIAGECMGEQWVVGQHLSWWQFYWTELPGTRKQEYLVLMMIIIFQFTGWKLFSWVYIVLEFFNKMRGWGEAFKWFIWREMK